VINGEGRLKSVMANGEIARDMIELLAIEIAVN
jgi:hypothetical protein